MGERFLRKSSREKSLDRRRNGSREMPVWGPVLHEVESDMDLGKVRLDAVTKTVERMQQD